MSRETKIGLLGIATLLIVFFGFNFLRGRDAFSSDATYYAVFDDVQGLAVGNNVTLLGQTIGKVSELSLNLPDANTVLVGVLVDEDVPFPKSTQAKILSDGLLGGAYLELSMEQPCTVSGDCAEDGDYFQAGKSSLLSSLVGDPAEIAPYLDMLRSNAGPLVDSITSRTDTNAIGRTIEQLELTSRNLSSLTARTDALLARSSRDLSTTLSNIAAITENIEANNARIASILANVDSVSGAVAGLALDETVAEVNASIAELRTTLSSSQSAISDLGELAQKLNEGEGSVGRLLNDDELALRLERAVTNADLLLQDFRLNPKRYVNVSVFGKRQKEYERPEDDPAEGTALEPVPTDGGQ